jgi:AbrB family looped-hinge helix DNA binding protein
MNQEATITENGTITIPKVIRDTLHLKKGTKVYFEIRGNHIVMFPEIKDPLEKLRQLRNKIQFSEKEIESMIKTSKKWSKISL